MRRSAVHVARRGAAPCSPGAPGARRGLTHAGADADARFAQALQRGTWKALARQAAWREPRGRPGHARALRLRGSPPALSAARIYSAQGALDAGGRGKQCGDHEAPLEGASAGIAELIRKRGQGSTFSRQGVANLLSRSGSASYSSSGCLRGFDGGDDVGAAIWCRRHRGRSSSPVARFSSTDCHRLARTASGG